MKILLRRKIILIPNRVRSLLDLTQQPQCPPVLARKQMKPNNQPVQQAAAASSRWRESAIEPAAATNFSQADVNSRSSHGTDEAVSEFHVFFPEDTSYYPIPDVKNTYFPRTMQCSQFEFSPQYKYD